MIARAICVGYLGLSMGTSETPTPPQAIYTGGVHIWWSERALTPYQRLCGSSILRIPRCLFHIEAVSRVQTWGSLCRAPPQRFMVSIEGMPVGAPHWGFHDGGFEYTRGFLLAPKKTGNLHWGLDVEDLQWGFYIGDTTWGAIYIQAPLRELHIRVRDSTLRPPHWYH